MREQIGSTLGTYRNYSHAGEIWQSLRALSAHSARAVTNYWFIILIW